LPWFLVYQVAAIFLSGALFLAIGAACNDFKDAQSLMLPVWMTVLAPMFVWFVVVKDPRSSFATWVSLIPPCTPMLMLLRQATPMGVPAWQPWVGLIGVAAFTTGCVWVAGRVFRVGMLMQGKTPKMSDLVRWAVRG
jgi:ABC-2 type transport system permease protein